MHLRAFTIVLILARELLVLETVEHLADGLRRLCEHGLEGDAGCEFAVGADVVDAVGQKGRDDEVVGGKLAIHGFDNSSRLF